MSTVTAATEESIKLWLKVGNLKKLEQAVLDGYGEQLRGRNSRIPKINKFLKRVPHFQAKIAAVHNAASQGNLRELENLLDRKGLVYARGSQGETPFHTAILNKQTSIIQYMVEKFPAILQARDHQGRTPLHYAAIVDNGADIFDMLLAAGADKDIKDLMGKTPSDYAENPTEYQLKPNENLQNSQNRHPSREFSSLLRQPSPITLMTKTEVKSMIQRGDLAKLERAILHGYGERLLGETAISTRVRDLLESIPEHLSKLTALQIAIESGSLRQVQNLLNRKGLVQARDSQGLTILHKAVLHEQKDIVKYLISMCPRAIFAKDHDKRTPVHYAAALSDNGEIYNLLTEAGGNTTLPDCDGKTPEYYRQNPTSLDLKKILEKRLEGSGKLNNTNSQGHQNKTTSKSGKRDPSGVSVTSSNSAVKQWLRSGDIEKLEKAVIDGYGLKLIRETTVDPRARAFLRTVPAYMAKIGAIHEAVCQGSLRDFKVLMDRKKLIMCKDQLGLGLLHKAVLYGHSDIVKYLIKNFPETISIKDKSGRTALHYAAAVKNKEELYNLLIEAGADSNQYDVKGNTAQHYYDNENDLDVNEIQNRVNRQRNRINNAGKQIKSSMKTQENGIHITGGNIRKWIHAQDIKKLEQVVLEGQGYKLLLETSNNPRVKHFLVSVPSLVNKIREIHNAVVTGDLQGVESAIEKPSLMLSKDEVGMTPLHKAVLLEQEEILQFIVNMNSQALYIKDEEGRTALHYAAGMKDSGRTYEMLEKAGADPQVADSRGKTAEHYLTHPGELDMRQLMSHVNRSRPTGYGKQETANNGVKRQAAPNLRPVRKASNNGINSEAITKIIQQGDTEKLEQLVLDGYGKKLIGKSSWNEDVRMFLKKVPHYMDRIYAIHTASALGDLRLLQQLLDKKKMVLSKDEYGLTALHKAVKYGQMDVVKYLLQTFPASHSAKDQDGRTPLHYAGMYNDRIEIYNLLISNGADPKIHDQRGKTPEYYFTNQSKLEAPTPPPKPLEKLSLENSDEKNTELDEEPIKDDIEIEEWIKSGDIDKLELLVISGQGNKLLGKASDDDKVQEFLEAVPAYMGKIRAIHNAAASGELKDLQSLLDKDILAMSLDEHEACPMHRAVLHGHKDVMKFLANNYPICLKAKDKSGLTPLHYAALISNDGYFYRLLSNCGADPNVKDKNGFTPGQTLRGNGPITLEGLLKRYEEKKVPPRPHSVQMWERPPTEEILKALTPSPMTEEHANALMTQSQKEEITDNSRDDAETAQVEDNVPNDQLANDSTEAQETPADSASKESEDIISDAKEEEEETPNAAEKDETEEADIAAEGLKESAEEPGDAAGGLDANDENVEDELQTAALTADVNEAVVKISENDGTDESTNANETSENEIQEEQEPEIEDSQLIPKENDVNQSETGESETVPTENEVNQSETGESETVPTENEVNQSETGESETVPTENEVNQPETGKSETVPAENEVDQPETGGSETISAENESNQPETGVSETIPAENEVDKSETGESKTLPAENEVDLPETGESEMAPEENEVNQPETAEEQPLEDNKLGEEDVAEQPDPKLEPVTDATADSAEQQLAEEPDFREETTDAVVNVQATSEETTEEFTEEGESLVQESEDGPKEEEGKEDEAEATQDSTEESTEKLDNKLDCEVPTADQGETRNNVEETGTTYEINSEEENSENQMSPSDNVVEEKLDEANNNSLLILQPSLDTGNPLHWTKEGEYLTAVLGDALITALAEVSRMKPTDPVAYLAVLLYRYLHKAALNTETKKDVVNDTKVVNGHNGHSPIGRKIKLFADKNGSINIQDLCKIKGEDGSTIVHYAAQKPHENDGFFQLLQQTNYNIAERDNFYRTIRDVAQEMGQQENVETIDRFVFHLVRDGKVNQIEALILDGYDHILDILDDEGNDAIMIAELTQHLDIAQQLQGIPFFQERLELLHELIRNGGDTEEVATMLENEPKLARAKNSKGQTALHMAILAENEDLVKIITNKTPPVVNVEDNMGRTPLHYAMGTTRPETFAKVVLKKGANQLIRDATSHLPSFYFINNQDIQKLKEEMDQITV